MPDKPTLLALNGGLFVLVLIFLIAPTPIGATLNDAEGLFALASLVVLAVTGFILYRQLHQIRDQGETQRIVASRNSLQEMNKIIFSDPDTFFPLLYPAMYTKTSTAEAGKEKATAFLLAFAAFNAWEVVYHLQGKKNPEDFKKLLQGIVKGSSIEQTWKNERQMRSAYDLDFQKLVDEVISGKPTGLPAQ